MTQIHFIYSGRPISLDMDKGVLLGDEYTVAQVRKIVDKIAEKHDGKFIGGEPWMPFDGVEITAPYHHADQFAMCLFYGLTDIGASSFPDDLTEYLNYHVPFGDVTGLSDEDAKIVQHISDNLVY